MQINLAPIQPVLDRLLRSGELTSEFRAWQHETLWAKVLTILGLVVTACSLVPQVFGADSHIATAVGGVATIAGQAQHILATMIYTGARSDQKESAADLVAKTVSSITQAAAQMPLIPVPAAPAPAPLIPTPAAS